MSNEDALRKWRLILGGQQNDGTGHSLEQVDLQMDRTLAQPTQQAIAGSLNRSARNRRPRHNEINWHRTILKNFQHH